MTAEVNYKGELRTSAVHLRSQNGIVTDAPTDNHGKGENFSPTDLVATALASCMLTVMGIAASKRELDITGAAASVNKIMASDPRRITRVEINITMPKGNFTDSQKALLEKIARNCPVAKSVHTDIDQVINFEW